MFNLIRLNGSPAGPLNRYSICKRQCFSQMITLLHDHKHMEFSQTANSPVKTAVWTVKWGDSRSIQLLTYSAYRFLKIDCISVLTNIIILTPYAYAIYKYIVMAGWSKNEYAAVVRTCTSAASLIVATDTSIWRVAGNEVTVFAPSLAEGSLDQVVWKLWPHSNNSRYLSARWLFTIRVYGHFDNRFPHLYLPNWSIAGWCVWQSLNLIVYL